MNYTEFIQRMQMHVQSQTHGSTVLSMYCQLAYSYLPWVHDVYIAIKKFTKLDNLSYNLSTWYLSVKCTVTSLPFINKQL